MTPKVLRVGEVGVYRDQRRDVVADIEYSPEEIGGELEPRWVWFVRRVVNAESGDWERIAEGESFDSFADAQRHVEAVFRTLKLYRRADTVLHRRGDLEFGVESRVLAGGDLECWDWWVLRKTDAGDEPLVEGVSWTSEEEARSCMEAVIRVLDDGPPVLGRLPGEIISYEAALKLLPAGAETARVFTVLGSTWPIEKVLQALSARLVHQVDERWLCLEHPEFVERPMFVDLEGQ